MADAVADLFVTLTAITAPFTAGMTEAAAAAESASAAILAAVAEINAATAEMGAGASVAATELAATDAEISAAVTTAAADTVAAGERITASYTAVATGISEDGGVIATAVGDTAAAAQAAADKIVASTVEQADAYAAMRDKIVADLEAVKAAEATAAESNAALGATMAGETEAMTTGAVATGTFKASLSDAAGTIGLTSGQLLGLGAGAAVVAGASAKMAGDFQQNTEKLVTSANETQANLDMVRQGILAMAGQVGYSAEQLATAMYKVESGGQHGAAGLQVLQAAAEGAKTENADLTTVADALTSAMTDYHAPASAAADITSKLVEATASGKMTFEELAGSLSAILPVASANHVALNEILGDMASMTMHGMSAQQASQNLADAIRHMAAPTQTQAKEFAMLGLSVQQVQQSLSTNGLSGTINMVGQSITRNMGPGATQVILNLSTALKGLPKPVQDLGNQLLAGSISYKQYLAAAKGLDPIAYAQAKQFETLAAGVHSIGNAQMSGAQAYQTYSGALRQAMGDATGMNVALMIGGENANNTTTAINNVSNATAQADGHVKGWAEIQGNFNQKLSQAKDGLEAMAISIGEKLLPVVTPIVGALADMARWVSKNQVAATAVAVVIGVVLVAAFIALAAAAWTAAAGVIAATWPILLIIAAVALLAFGVYELISHWSQVVDFFKGLWKKVSDAFTTAVHWIGDRIGDIVKFFTDLPGKIGGFLSNLGSTILNKLKSIGEDLIRPFKDAWDKIKAFFSQSPQQIGEELGRAAGMIVRKAIDIGKGILDGIKKGWDAVVAWFKALPQNIANFFIGANNWLEAKGTDLIQGAWDGIKKAWNDVVAWFKALPKNIADFFVSANTWLQQKGTDLIHGAWDGIKKAWNDVVAWFKALPGNIAAFFKDAPTWLVDHGKAILEGLWNGITGFVKTIYDGITGFISGFIDGFKKGLGISSPSTIFLSIGQDVIQGLWNGVTNIWNGFIGFVQGLPGKITDLFKDAGNWLINAGRSLVEGLWNGIQQLASWLWNQITSWASGLVKAALSALGVHSPSVHMHEAGMQMVIGLANGIQDHAHIAAAAAEDMARQVLSAARTGSTFSGTMASTYSMLGGDGASLTGMGGMAAQTAVASALGGTAGGGELGSAAAPVTIQVTVQGSVLSENDLAQTVQQVLLRHNIRNTSNATSYGGFA